MKLRIRPPMTMTIGYGVSSFRARTPKTTTKRSSRRKTSSTVPIAVIERALSLKILWGRDLGVYSRPRQLLQNEQGHGRSAHESGANPSQHLCAKRVSAF